MPLIADLASSSPDCYCTNTYLTATWGNGSPPYSYTLRFGDGTPPYTVSGVTATAYYTNHHYAAGTYTATLAVTCASGCTDTASTVVTVYANPTANFDQDKRSCCLDLTVCFTDTSVAGSNAIKDWYWDFGDSVTSTERNPCHTYTKAGTYTVTLTVTDAHGCTDTVVKADWITANAPPEASFTQNRPSCCLDQTVCFTDTSMAGSNPIVAWYWEFGDGGTSSAQNPCHTYTAAGTYTVTLMVTDSHGCSDGITVEGAVTANEPPSASFTQNKPSCCLDQTVCFTDTSVAGSNPIVAWYWDFGDGSTSSSRNPCHTYTVAGTYSVTLTVTDSHGCSDSVTLENAVTANEPPSARFTQDKASGCLNLTVCFTDTSVAGSNPIVAWYWEFGDGETSTEQNPCHTYMQAGTYDVRLTVTDSSGCTNTIVREGAVEVIDCVRLEAIKYRPHGPVVATWTFWYYICITNTGTAPAVNLMVTDTLPLGIAPYSVHVSPGGTFDPVHMVVTWTVSSLGPGYSTCVWIAAQTYSGVAGTCITNRAVITAENKSVPVVVIDVACVESPPAPTPTPTPTYTATPTPTFTPTPTPTFTPTATPVTLTPTPTETWTPTPTYTPTLPPAPPVYHIYLPVVKRNVP